MIKLKGSHIGNIMHRIQYMLVLFLASGIQHIRSMKLTKLDVPRIADFRDDVVISCSYSMGRHKLNSVKWYKDDQEFFRYSPTMPSTLFLTFPVEGVQITKNKYSCNEFTCSVEVISLQMNSSGAYRCEVSGDAPEFKLISQTRNMTVAGLPQRDPLIYGVSPSYRFDEVIEANCSSDWSSPAATLSWYINDERAPPELLLPVHETTMNMEGFNLCSKNLGIYFRLDKARFANTGGILKMKCLADIESMPTLIREKTVQIVILSKDDLMNQKLVISRNSSQGIFHGFTFWLVSFLNIVLRVVSSNADGRSYSAFSSR